MAYAATWNVCVFATSQRSTAVSHRVYADGSSALAFGGGTRADTILTAIQLNGRNSSLHVATAATITAVDGCAAPHANVLTYSATATGCYINNAAALTTFAVGTPATSRGVGFYFKYNDGATAQATEVTQCQIWAGTGAGVTGNPQGCNIYLVELQQNTKSWSAATSDSKVPLHTSFTKDIHFWPIGISLVATAVGFKSNNRVKIENTFQ